MKKLLLLTLALMSAFAVTSARSLTYYYEGKPVPAGTTINFEGYEEYDWGTQTEIYIDPKMQIMKDSPQAVSMRATSTHDILFCIGTNCAPGTTILKENLAFDANKLQDLLLDCSIFFDKGQEIKLPEIKVQMEAWYVDEPDNVTLVNINMGSAAGVSDVTSDNNTVTYAGGKISYSVDAKTVISVVDLTGHVVKSHSVTGQGYINLSHLPKGLYIYRTEGAVKKTGKIIVK